MGMYFFLLCGPHKNSFKSTKRALCCYSDCIIVMYQAHQYKAVTCLAAGTIITSAVIGNESTASAQSESRIQQHSAIVHKSPFKAARIGLLPKEMNHL